MVESRRFLSKKISETKRNEWTAAGGVGWRRRYNSTCVLVRQGEVTKMRKDAKSAEGWLNRKIDRQVDKGTGKINISYYV